MATNTASRPTPPPLRLLERPALRSPRPQPVPPPASVRGPLARLARWWRAAG